ncbi:uncharacterized protein [Macrobrachium rosenbergii]|uniref:uncharacterized protein n=1 Tax=Macrobrachium rosenbergii TaxID=79674 RepID=UPI0034D58547
MYSSPADVWIYLLVTIMIWGVCLWALQRTESRLSGEGSESLSESILYGWAAIVDHPPEPPSNLVGQMMVGWLLSGILLISSCFKSSLVAHLTVENKEKPIDDYEGLVKKVNWKWGIEKFILNGAPLLYFSKNPDPVIQFIYNHTESMMGDLGLEKVRAGRFSFLSSFNRISYFLGVFHSDAFGRHPFYVSRSRYRISSDTGLGIRKGAPFLRRFSQLVPRLTDAGIINHWIKNVLKERIREDRILYRQKMKAQNAMSTGATAQPLEDEREIVLRMEHFLGVYIVFLCGLGMAFVTFLVEIYSKHHFQPLLVVDLSTLQEGDKRQLLESFLGSPLTTCRAAVVDIMAAKSSEALFRFLEASKLWQWPEARVFLLGTKSRASSFLQHPALRNSISVLYFHMKGAETTQLQSPQNSSPSDRASLWQLPPGSRHVAYVYSRCLYCKDGQAQTRLLFTWHLGTMMPQISDPFPDPLTNFRGALIRVGTFPYFPYSDYNRPPEGSNATTVELLDSLDKRLLRAISLHLNATFEFQFPLDYQPGYLAPNGSWTGVMKLILEDKAEMTTSVVVNPDRMTLIDFKVTCEIDRLGIVSLAPQALPRYLVILRPFTTDVWIYILLSTLIWSFSFWALQMTWSKFSGGQSMTLNEAIFYGSTESYGCNTETCKTSKNAPSDLHFQMMVGWWLIVSLLLTTGFRSALVAHLSVESKTQPIDNFEDLLRQSNWGWGFEQALLRGAPGFYFRYNTDPVVQRINKSLEGIDSNAGLEKVKRGHYSLLGTRNKMYSLIASYHLDTYGRSPFHFSKTTYRIASDLGLGFRKGVPFRRRLSQLINRLTEGGIINLWIQDVLDTRIKESRDEITDQEEEEISLAQAAEKQIVLRMTHLMGVFLIFLSGNGIALVSFVVERFGKRTYN